MRWIKIITLFATLLLSYIAYSQEPDVRWDKWKYLIGDWVGEGSGKPGSANGNFSFHTDLDENVLIRKSHTVYPSDNGKPERIHDDLMIIYGGGNGTPSKAIYFDNEGHTINYDITYPEHSFVFTSTTVEKGPVFRLSYVPIDSTRVTIKFEASSVQNPNAFKPYLEGKARKAPDSGNK